MLKQVMTVFGVMCLLATWGVLLPAMWRWARRGRWINRNNVRAVAEIVERATPVPGGLPWEQTPEQRMERRRRIEREYERNRIQ